MARRRYTDLDVHELRVQMRPDLYSIAAFRGSGQFARGKVNTFLEAVALAKRLLTDRPVAVYAVRGHNQSHIININSRTQEIRMAYLITYTYGGGMKNVEIATYAAAEMARAASETIKDPAVGAMVLDSELDIKGSNQLIADLYNALHTVDDPHVVERFSSKADGQKRLFERVEARAKGQPVLSIEVSPTELASSKQEANVATKKATKKTAKAKPAKASKAAAGDRKRIDKSLIVNVNVEKNPLREGSAAYERFKFFRTGQTVEKAIEKGAWMADVRWCVKKKFISLVKPS